MDLHRTDPEFMERFEHFAESEIPNDENGKLDKKTRYLAILAALIGFSRLYLYVHYPTDVLAGAVLGALLGWVGCTLIRLVERRFYHHDHSAQFRS